MHTLIEICIYIGIFVLCVLYTSELEYRLHCHIMHKPLGKFRYPFEAHTIIHHRIFRADKSYHLQNEVDKETIRMAWWNGPFIIIIASIPPLLISLAVGMWSIVLISFSVTALYYGAYEYMHWCMHLPRPERLIEKSPIIGPLFVRLNGHHLLHHRYMNRNFNVVLPFADFIHGTLLIRSKDPFNQARGPSVPNVQPKNMQ